MRLVRWSSLAVPVTATLALSVLLRLAGRDFPAAMVPFVAAAVAGVAPASLDDTARELMAAVPVTGRRRSLHRLAIVVPSIFAGWLVAVAAMFRVQPGWSDTLAPLGALVAIGVAATLVATRVRPDAASAVGVGVPLLAAVLQWLVEPGAPFGSLSQVWIDHPLPTTAAAGFVAIVTTSERIGPARVLLTTRGRVGGHPSERAKRSW